MMDFVSVPLDNKNVTLRLPVITTEGELWSFLEILTEEMQCCANFMAREPVVCEQCTAMNQGILPISNSSFIIGLFIKNEHCLFILQMDQEHPKNDDFLLRSLNLFPTKDQM